MKITDFLKKYSLINEKFIDDFYTFYDEKMNIYDYSIDLEIIAEWLEVRKEHLKRLLFSNFSKNEDFIENKIENASTTKIIVLLTYECSKLLCMISKSPKADLIRKYYIELEKLVLKYKEEIDESINRQLGIKNNNNKIIEQNKDDALIYVLSLENEDHKIGSTINIKNRMAQYNVGRIYELP